MQYISRDEYDRLFEEFVKTQEPIIVDAVVETWDWHIQKQKEFDKKLAEKGIAKQK